MTNNEEKNKSNAVGAFVAGAATATAAAIAVGMTDKKNREKAIGLADKAHSAIKDVKDSIMDKASEIKDDVDKTKQDLSGKVKKTTSVWNK
jgi:uncharacterized protein (UPF0264 family)